MSKENENVWEDIVFEKRNKSYGAYNIRRSYSNNVMKGSLFVGLFVAVLVLSSFLRSPYVAPPVVSNDDDDVVCLIPINLPKPPAPERDRAPVRRIEHPNTTPQVTTAPVEDPLPAPNSEVVMGSVNGTENGEEAIGPEEPSTGAGTGTELNGVGGGEEIVFVTAEEMPQFEGGMSELIRYLQRKLKYPASARRNETEGTVYVGFVVGSSGEIRNVEVIKGISKDCDAEAVRVISSMPKWKAGRQNKYPVSVKMVLPIKFALAH